MMHSILCLWNYGANDDYFILLKCSVIYTFLSYKINAKLNEIYNNCK